MPTQPTKVKSVCVATQTESFNLKFLSLLWVVNNLDPSYFYLVIGKLGRVLEVHLLYLQRAVTGGQGQATQGVPASAPFPDNCHDLLLDGVCQGNTGGSNTHICTPVDHTFGGALRRQQAVVCSW